MNEELDQANRRAAARAREVARKMQAETLRKAESKPTKNKTVLVEKKQYRSAIWWIWFGNG